MVDQPALDDPMPLDEVNFFDPAINDCPYHAYRTLRDDAPVWFDERLKAFVVTRHEDVLAVLRDTKRFNNAQRRASRPEVQALYEEKGWVPARTLAGRDDPNHREMRQLFDHAFRPKKLRALEPQIEGLAHELIDDFIDAGECDWVQQFAVPLPLVVIGMQMGADPADIWRIKAWTDAWVQRLGLMQTPEQVIWSTEMEIEAQHYFQPIFERLRETPDDTLLSDLVNTEIPEWGRCLTDEELHAEMMADTFVGGSETTTNALSGGVRLLIEHPDQWDRLTSDPERYLPRARRGGAASGVAGAAVDAIGCGRRRTPRGHDPRRLDGARRLLGGEPRRPRDRRSGPASISIVTMRRSTSRSGSAPTTASVRRSHGASCCSGSRRSSTGSRRCGSSTTPTSRSRRTTSCGR